MSYYSTANEIRDSKTDIVILPIGSTEQHGPHLPLATDCIIANAVSEKLAEKLGAFLLPVIPITTSREHMGKKGSIWINADTLYYLLKDITESLKYQGFKRVVMVLGHGGLFVVNPTVREINAANSDIKVIKVDLLDFQYLQTNEIGAVLEGRDNLHACEYETSLMLYLHDELVRKDRIVDCEPGVPRGFLNYASIFKYCKDGVWGRATLGTRDKGEKIFELLVQKSIEYIDQVNKIFEG